VLAIMCALAGARTVEAAPPDAGAPEAELLPPVVTVGVQPYAYPDALLEREVPPAGVVQLRYVVGTDGVPKEIELLEGVDPSLDAIAVDVVAALRFEPASYAGEAVEVVLSIEIPFTPPERAPEPELGEGEDEGEGEGEGEGSQPPAGPLRISGVLREAGRNSPIGGATILAIPAGEYELGKVRHKLYGDEREPAWMVRGLSDDEGEFELYGVPDGPVRLIMLAPNFERLEWVVELEAGERLEAKYFLTRKSARPDRTEDVDALEQMPENETHQISQ
jgi:hypothetical protein